MKIHRSLTNLEGLHQGYMAPDGSNGNGGRKHIPKYRDKHKQCYLQKTNQDVPVRALCVVVSPLQVRTKRRFG